MMRGRLWKVPALLDEAANESEVVDPTGELDPSLDPKSYESQLEELLAEFDDSEEEIVAKEFPSGAPAPVLASEPSSAVELLVAPANDAAASSSDRAPLLEGAGAAEAPPSPPAEGSARRPRRAPVQHVVQPGVIKFWGCFRISMLVPKEQGRPFGALEASCPFHKRSAKTE